MSTNIYFQHYVITQEKLSKYMIFDIDYKGDLPLCIRVSKEMIRKKMMR